MYTWTAIDADTKLIPSWFVGTRGSESAHAFISDLAGRMANRVQLTTDGHKAYLEAVENAFHGDIDYAMLVKLYGNNPKEDQRKYSLSKFKGAVQGVIPPKRAASKSRINTSPAFSAGRVSLLKPSYAFALE